MEAPRSPGLSENPRSDVAPPRTLGDFVLERVIGHGGMGEVWRAQQLSVARPIALKLLPAHMSIVPRAVLRFRREAEAGGRLSHPNIALVYSAGLVEGRLYIAQELIEGGQSFADWIKATPRDGRLDSSHFDLVRERIGLVARALHYAHGEGVTHRDIKPHNLLLTARGVPKVVDFGLARVDDGFTVSQSGEIAGTFAYMSPEQAQAHASEIDHRTDVFSLGSTLYELLTLQQPFTGNSAFEISHKIIHEAPQDPRDVRPEVPTDLAAACLRALAKRREDRFQSMADFAAALADARPSDSRPETRAGSRRRTFPALIAVAAGIAVLLGLWIVRPPAADPGESRHLDPSANIYKQSVNYEELAAVARQRVAEAEEELANPLPEEVLLERLRQIVVPRVVVPKSVDLAAALASIEELRLLPITCRPAVQRNETTRELDFQFPIRADALLTHIASASSSVWFATEREIVFAREREWGPVELRVHPLSDLLGLGADSDGLITMIDGMEAPTIVLSSASFSTLIQEFVAVGSWELVDVSIGETEQAIIVAHAPRVHRRVTSLLAGIRCCVLLDRPDHRFWDHVNPGTEHASEDDRTRLIVSNMSVAAPRQGASLEVSLAEIERQLGRDVVVESRAPDQPASWPFREPDVAVGAGSTYRPFNEVCALPWRVVGGVVLLGGYEHDVPAVLRAYPIWDLTYATRGKDRGPYIEFRQAYSKETIENLVRDLIKPAWWNENTRITSRATDSDLLLISAPVSLHSVVEKLLAELRLKK